MFRCETVASDANVRILKVTGRQRFSEYLSHVAVWQPSGRITTLGDYAEFLGGVHLGSFALAGPFVGLSTYTGNHETGEAFRPNVSSAGVPWLPPAQTRADTRIVH